MTTTYETVTKRVQEAFQKELLSDSPVDVSAIAIIDAGFPSAGFSRLADKRIAVRAFPDQNRITFDDCIKHQVVRLVEDAVASGQPLMEYMPPGSTGGQVLQRFLNICAWLADASLEPAAGQTTTTHSIPPRVLEFGTFVALVEDLMEAGTIGEAAAVFGFLEAQLGFIKRDDVFAKVKLIVLRLCNHLLKRLSKAHDSQLCGRILFFLARFFQLSERSGVNVSGLVNSGLHLPVDEVAPGAVDSIGEPIDPRLYTTFWGLQSAFQNPAAVLSSANSWEKTLADIQYVITEIGSYPITVNSGTAKRASTVAGGDNQADIAVSYLSSSQLFGLQLRDATFRRTFLVQVLILLHAATVHPMGQTATSVPAGIKDAKRVAEMDSLQTMAYAALSSTPDDGEAFTRDIRSILARETGWVNWKKDSCPALERPPVPLVPAAAAAAAAAEASSKGPPAKRRRPGGGAPRPTPRALLNAMLEVPSNSMVGLKMAERVELPTLREYLQPVIEGMDPENGIEEAYKKQNDVVYAWRVMRLVSRVNIDVYSTSLSKSLEHVVGQLYPEFAPPPPIPVPPTQQGVAGSVPTTATAAAAAAATPDCALAEAPAVGVGNGGEVGAVPGAMEAEPMQMDAVPIAAEVGAEVVAPSNGVA